MNWIKYAPAAVAATVIIMLFFGLHYKDRQIETLTFENTQLRMEVTLADRNIAAAHAAIVMQNEQIALHSLDMDTAEKQHAAELAALKGRTTQTKIQIVERLAKDPSCENELLLIRETLTGYLSAKEVK